MVLAAPVVSDRSEEGGFVLYAADAATDSNGLKIFSKPEFVSSCEKFSNRLDSIVWTPEFIYLPIAGCFFRFGLFGF